MRPSMKSTESGGTDAYRSRPWKRPCSLRCTKTSLSFIYHFSCCNCWWTLMSIWRHGAIGILWWSTEWLVLNLGQGVLAGMRTCEPLLSSTKSMATCSTSRHLLSHDPFYPHCRRQWNVASLLLKRRLLNSKRSNSSIAERISAYTKYIHSSLKISSIITTLYFPNHTSTTDR